MRLGQCPAYLKLFADGERTAYPYDLEFRDTSGRTSFQRYKIDDRPEIHTRFPVDQPR